MFTYKPFTSYTLKRQTTIYRYGARSKTAILNKLLQEADPPSFYNPLKHKADDLSTMTQTKDRKPVVAIVGRPNVGKSSMFNRFVKESKSVVTDIAGTTRDRVYGICKWKDWPFIVVDTGGMLGDTHEWSSDIHEQAMLAVNEADVVLFVTDTITGLDGKEKQIAKVLRKHNKPILVLANKADNQARQAQDVQQFYQLGLDAPLAVSAIHGHNEVDMLDTLLHIFNQYGFKREELEPLNAPLKELKLAIVGKPNVGKSSLLNAIIGEERAIVSDVEGTTIDPVDESIEWDYEDRKLPITLIDTAGIRRKRFTLEHLEKISGLWALKVIERSHLALLVLDATEGIKPQVLH